MKFCRLPLDEARGAILAHGFDALHLKKGHVLTAADVEVLRAAGETEVMAARLDADDVAEDLAAQAVALAAAGEGLRLAEPFTGRCNLHALASGVLVIDSDRVERLNLVDEAITLATLPAFEAVRPGQMVATVKLIPFAAPARSVELCRAIAGGGLVRVATFRPCLVGLVMTTLPGTKALDKARAVVHERLAALGSRLVDCVHCDHDERAVAFAVERLLAGGCEMVLVLGASAVVDRGDVIPAAIRRLGGEVDFFGMPVDPGNLLLLGHRGPAPIIGLPGCARSPKLNGFDYVLRRILAGLAVTRADVARMGVGGLLDEIATRPQLREGESEERVIPLEPDQLRRA